jgi:glycosyltransferase involved in cell wall biosynthesis
MIMDSLPVKQFACLISIVVPCFNEEENVPVLYDRICKQCASFSLEIIFVDDGSDDATKQALDQICKKDRRVSVVSFTRNAGQQVALRAGLKYARGEYALTMDADLQHSPELVPRMLEKAKEGYDIVNMVRSVPQKGFLKNLLSKGFYVAFNNIAEIKIVVDSSDFRLMSHKVYSVINSLPERNMVLRALLPLLGFRSVDVTFTPQERHSGPPRYTFGKSIGLGLDSFINFSTLPLRLFARFGFTISFLAFAYGLFAVITRLTTDWNIPGYTDILASVLFLGGIIIVYLSLMGRYIQLILDHLKMRPEYVIESVSLSAGPRNNPPKSDQSVDVSQVPK